MFKGVLLDITILLSNCTDSGLKGKVHRYVLTGGLQIVGYNKFTKLFTRGPKYAETTNTSWKKAKSSVTEGLNDCIDTWYCKHEIENQDSWNGRAKINKINKKNKNFIQRNIFNVS